jgi:hypothetical protein
MLLLWRALAIAGGLGFLALVAWTLEPVIWDRGSESVTTNDVPEITPKGTASPTDPVLVGAGDIAACTQEFDEQTAALLDQIVAGGTANGVETVVFTAGDNAYENGTLQEYEQCYGPTWGRHKDRTRPATGNHEYALGNADGHFQYFGELASTPGVGYYSFDLGTWHIVVLDTGDHCQIVTCAAGSPQEQWLRADLAANPAVCTLAIWHDPLFTSSPRASAARYVVPFWRALYEYGADVIVSAHEHNYERFATQTADGIFDPDYGIRQFVVGTGGNGFNTFEGQRAHNSEAADDQTYGVISLTLHPAGYDWEFVPVAGSTFRDSGSGDCHGSPPSLPPDRAGSDLPPEDAVRR